MLRYDVATTIVKNFEILTDDSKDLLLRIINKQEARSLIFSYKLRKPPKYIVLDAKFTEIMGNEGAFLLGSVVPPKNGDIDLSDLVKLPNFNWSSLWRDLLEQEEETLVNLSTSLLTTISYKVLPVMKPYFYSELIHRSIDNEICMLILEKSRSFNDLLSLVKEIDGIRKSVGVNKVEIIFKSRLSYLIKKRFVRLSARGTYRAGKALALSGTPRKKMSSDERVLDHIQNVLNAINLPPKLLSNFQNRANEIISRVENDIRIESHKPRSVAAGILFYLIRPYRGNAAELIYSYIGVNPRTTRMHYKIIMNILTAR